MNAPSNTKNPNRALSDKERLIVLELAHGKTVKEIARALNISYQGVFQKLSRARAKRNARTSYQLIYLVAVGEIAGEPAKNQETQHAQPAVQPKTKPSRASHP